MDLSNPPFLPGRNKALDLLKWLAMLSMVLDHLRYVGWSVDFLYVPGRFAFPWFCLAIAVNLSRRSAAILAPRVQWRYLGWLLAFAALSEIPYRLFMADVTVLNVMPTLLLGLLIAQGWQHRNVTTRIMAIVALLLGAVFQQQLMFGFAGVLLPLVFLLVLQKRLWYSVFPAAFCLAGNAWPQMFAGASWGDPISIGSIAACLVAPALGIALLRTKPKFAVIPMRRWAYAIYPLHFLVLLGLRTVLERG
ncbi:MULTISPECIES: TraX family protein [Pseudomonas syringae group genomosp. 2]|uniref:TraX family protein n=3 Tax=Pseudomonas syringae group genomosp. 2 TaxID=251698 RepID=A0A0N8RMK7_PSESG|nr:MULTISPECIES: TraX family protein [Pseudomonas syringae group genomosp. 2]EGH24013.1 TraX family protein [Pseudomonas amygdali pv. mori str. 301020]KPW41881.1 TraX family protein [Pseudomonas amygdali]EFW82410.1 TraX family protein [Pseudomonas savastanoi pv. glycinea str. B076]EFW87590.1 TraX family protein [Pseudomonas savastanoi pv. glycinea str. race 4]EGH06525.1 TraX family protein [Pseudomonas savastanoi pv. glycinea str. race 4]